MESNSADKSFQLPKRITLVQGVCLVIGVCIGSGIYVTPGKVILATNGSVGLSIFVWILSGLLCGLSALCYCELGSCVKESGLDYTYFYVAFGPLPAFLYQWVMVTLATTVGNAIKLIIFGSYFVSLLGVSLCKQEGSNLAKVSGILVLSAVTIIQFFSVKQSLRLEVFITTLKVLSMTLFLAVGIFHLTAGNAPGVENFRNAFRPEELDKVQFLSIWNAVYFCTYTYNGWQVLNSATEEIINFQLLGAEEMTTGDVVAAKFAQKVFGSVSWLIPLIICASVLGSLNGGLFAGARVLYSAASKGHMPQIFSMVHIHRYTPIPALIYKSSLTMIILYVGNFESLLLAYEFLMWSINGLSAVSLLVLRWKQPRLRRPCKIPLPIPVVVVIASLALVLLPLIERPTVSILGSVAYILAGIPLYYIFVIKQAKIPGISKCTYALQCILQVASTSPETLTNNTKF
ncbi:cystine/glutamate transporter-like isoform X2 [Clavelina lepadiformis]|uniref:cystine/glutamate transporter-like isoform X2 n=1 Tax=Clavelina lepadiformis TaxID=159417 RepID=UPI0040421293